MDTTPLLIDGRVHDLGDGFGQQSEFPFRDELRQRITGDLVRHRRLGWKRKSLALRRLKHRPIMFRRIRGLP